MIEEKYRHLSLSEQEQFARVVNRLLSNTFLLVEEYDPAEGVTRVNREYLFVERNFELFREYPELSACKSVPFSPTGETTGNRVQAVL